MGDKATQHKRVGLPMAHRSATVVCGHQWVWSGDARKFWKDVDCTNCLKKRPEKKRDS
jgi:hypothetical protein